MSARLAGFFFGWPGLGILLLVFLTNQALIPSLWGDDVRGRLEVQASLNLLLKGLLVAHGAGTLLRARRARNQGRSTLLWCAAGSAIVLLAVFNSSTSLSAQEAQQLLEQIQSDER